MTRQIPLEEQGLLYLDESSGQQSLGLIANVRFKDSSSNRNSRTEDGDNCSSARVRSRTLGSETLKSRLGGDWSA